MKTLSLVLLTATAMSLSAQAKSDQVVMQEGLDKMYSKTAPDPIGAAAKFREVLKHTPTHYGAHYQLAVALDRGGSPRAARAEWEAVKKGAQAINDQQTLATATKRLASPDTASQEAMMTLGLHYAYVRKDYAAAITQFRAVIRKNPTHYGANFQLAKALDLSGQKAQATPVWQVVLGMATQYKDQQTIAIARERLK